MKKPEGEEVLLRIAEAISDGAPVDWETETTAHEEMRGRLARLRLLEALAHAHRDAADATTGAPDPGATDPTLDSATNIPAGAVAPLSGRWGPLEILERVGRGGFGEVYRAFDPLLRREVALKLRRPDAAGAPRSGHGASRFLEEARRLARVRHPNVLVVHGADLQDGQVGLWTDLLDGRTLEQCLAEHGLFSPHEAAVIGIDLCRALAAVHAAGLVHRDIKTSNVMREKGGRIVLMDFSSVSETAEVRRSGKQPVSGTPLTMAPETMLDAEAPAPSADIYSLGVLLYRLVSGRYPIEAKCIDDIFEAHRRGAATPLRDLRPDLPAPFVQVVEKALCIDPRRRHESAGAMERALSAAIGSAPDLRPAPTPARSGWRPRPRWLAAGATLAVLVAAVTSYLGLAPPANVAFAVEASLFREGRGVQERLQNGGRVFPGDQLFLELKASEAIHVYVLNEDRLGDTFVMFPLRAEVDLRNPLPARVMHRLPGRLAGVEQHWAVTSAGGKETILVIASKRPLKDLEEEISKFPRAEPGRPIDYGRVDIQALPLIYRGIGGMVGKHPRAEMESRLSEIARRIPERGETPGDLWMRRIELENPSP